MFSASLAACGVEKSISWQRTKGGSHGLFLRRNGTNRWSRENTRVGNGEKRVRKYLESLATTSFRSRMLFNVLIVSTCRVKSWSSGSPGSITTPSMLGPKAGANSNPLTGTDTRAFNGTSLRHMSRAWGLPEAWKSDYSCIRVLSMWHSFFFTVSVTEKSK